MVLHFCTLYSENGTLVGNGTREIQKRFLQSSYLNDSLQLLSAVFYSLSMGSKWGGGWSEVGVTLYGNTIRVRTAYSLVFTVYQHLNLNHIACISAHSTDSMFHNRSYAIGVCCSMFKYVISNQVGFTLRKTKIYNSNNNSSKCNGTNTKLRSYCVNCKLYSRMALCNGTH